MYQYHDTGEVKETTDGECEVEFVEKALAKMMAILMGSLFTLALIVSCVAFVVWNKRSKERMIRERMRAKPTTEAPTMQTDDEATKLVHDDAWMFDDDAEADAD